jgi:aryl-alcohol dehydrogenase-like predicted oxidoreductase
VVVGTKVRLTPDDLRDPTAAVRASVEASLGRLGGDAVDLLQLHNHIVGAPAGDDGPLDVQRVTEGVAEALERVKRDGLARHIGFTGLGDTPALHAVVRSGTFETVQCYFNAINPSAGFPGASGGEQDFQGLIDAAASAGLGVIAIRVLAAGALTARPERAPNAGEPGAPLIQGADYTRDLEKARAVDALAVELGLESPIELGVRFALSKREVSTVLVGYSSVEQLEDAIRWAERGPLPPEVVRRVVDLAR